jgi:predicted thioesterase
MCDVLGKASTLVSKGNLAKTLKTGAVNAFSSSAISKLMEEALVNVLNQHNFAPDLASIGISMNLTHEKHSPIGANITAISRLIDITQNGFYFEIEIHDDVGLIGTGFHERTLVKKNHLKRSVKKSSRAQEKRFIFRE